MSRKTQKLRRVLTGALTVGALTFSGFNVFAVDPCEMNLEMKVNQNAQNGGTHDIPGTPYNYEMWTNSPGGSNTMTYSANEDYFQFHAKWSNPDDLLCRLGLYWGTGPKPDELKGDLHCDFNYEVGQGSSGGGYNYICIYGWTKVPNEVEYYIVENTFFGSTAKQQGLYYNTSSLGTYTMDGDTYELWKGTRTGPSISGNSTFTQVFAVRKSIRKCGHISISAHMRKWKEKGITLGQLYDCKFLCEVGSGSGSFDLKYGKIWVGDADSNGISFSSPESGKKFSEGDEVTFTLKPDTKTEVKSIDITVDGKSIANLTSSPWSTKWTATAGSHTVKATATLADGKKVEASTTVRVSEPQAPYKSAFAIPGTVEAEDYDKGGPDEAYGDSDEKNEGDAKYRTDEFVDVVKAGNGMAVGYTTTSEWLEYTIDVAEAGKYDVEASMSCGSGDPTIDLSVDGKKLASLTGTGKNNDWDTYASAKGSVELSAGKQILKVSIKAANTNVDYIKFTKAGTSSQEGQQQQQEQQTTHESTTEGSTASNDPGVYPISYSVENTGAGCPDPVSLDKNKLKSCKTLPSPFEWADGSGKVTDFCDWSCRRNEIKREIEYWEIGEKPKFDKLEASYSGGTLTVKIYNGSNSLTLTSNISVPSGNGPHPIVIGMDGNTGSISSSYFSKCIQVKFTHSQIAEYNSGMGGGGRSQNDPFYKLYPGTFNTKADYCAWSWGISRLIDGLEIVKDQIKADLGHIAVTGCSYAGKMALYAGAFDERIALTIAQESGGGGINSWRVSSEIGSDVEGISNTNYDWFLSSFKSNFQSQIDKLPYDHHELIAMIAPRAFLAFGNPDYVWLGDASGIASLKAAEEVWKAMGIEDRFGYVVEGGHTHCSASSNQNKAAQAFINKFLHGDNSQNTKVRTSTVNSNHSSGKYDWGNHKIVNNGCGNTSGSETIVIDQFTSAEGYSLSQNTPNPASDETSIEFSIPENAYVSIALYNQLGVKVMDIVNEEFEAGIHTMSFDASMLPAGVYHYVMISNGFIANKSLLKK